MGERRQFVADAPAQPIPCTIVSCFPFFVNGASGRPVGLVADVNCSNRCFCWKKESIEEMGQCALEVEGKGSEGVEEG